MNLIQNNGSPAGYGSIPVGFPWKILVFALVVFLFALFVFVGLKFGYASYLDRRDKTLDTRINQLAAVVSQEDQQQFISFYSQLVNLKEVLGKHTGGSETLSLLERHTIPSVHYVSAKILPKDKRLEVSGRAGNLDSFIEQMYVLDSSTDFRERATVTQMGFDQGQVVFTALLYPREEVFSQ